MGEERMADIAGILGTLLCFVIALVYVHGCDALKGAPRHD